MLAASARVSRSAAVKPILILGGYGGFGARLSRRLAKAGYPLLIAGRNAAKANEFAASLAGAQGIAADRRGDIAALLAEHGPHLLIDAAGPFQDSDYRVPLACIDAGVHYLDLADAREFVCGIAALHDRAEADGLCIISGASSVPAVSGAVLRDLCQGFDRVDAVDMAITASNRATAGPSVAAAILSYAGKPVRLWRGRQWPSAYGWHEKRRLHLHIEGQQPLRRLVALADVPDHELVPARFPGQPSTRFYAGPEFAFQLRTISLLSWLVRLGWVSSLSRFARWLLPLQRLTGWAGSDRSAMLVEIKGLCGDRLRHKRWTLIAEQGDGPEIPVLAAQLLADAICKGKAPIGARDAGGLLSLGDFQPLFDDLAIRHEQVTNDYTPLYQRVMGEAFDRLPAPVRDMHSIAGDGGATGSATVERGRSWGARLVAAIVGFPPAGEHALHVSFAEDGGVERWTRNFAGHIFASELSEKRGLLIERFGPLRFHFDLPPDASGLQMVMRKWSAFGIRLPLALAPKSEAREWAEGVDFCFDVPIKLPLIGLVVHYRGRLRRI
jgi:saccharopine dehydrogenase-like NADP-dependent oxidoreductase